MGLVLKEKKHPNSRSEFRTFNRIHTEGIHKGIEENVGGTR